MSVPSSVHKSSTGAIQSPSTNSPIHIPSTKSTSYELSPCEHATICFSCKPSYPKPSTVTEAPVTEVKVGEISLTASI